MTAVQQVDKSTSQFAAASRRVDLSSDDLGELMRSVTQTTQRLERTHVALHREVKRLQDELAEANAALRRSQALAALGEMAAGIAHEIRNPLGSIQLYVHMLADDLADRPDQAELCGKIERAVTGLDSVVRDVLRFARDPGAPSAINVELVRADELLDRAMASCKSLTHETLEVMHSPAPHGIAVEFQADGSLLVRALSNVIRNAIEAMVEADSPRKRLVLSAARRRVRCPSGRPEARIVLSVEDTGPGIPPDVVDRIFNPFFTTRKTGTGLGLAIVHRIVDAHGGHITIEAGAGGIGTRVNLCLPIDTNSSITTKPHPTEHGA